MTVGAVTLFILGLAFKIGVDSIKKTINIRLDQRHSEEVALRKENEEDMIHSMEGQQIICDCLHEMSIMAVWKMYQMIWSHSGQRINK